MRAFLYSLFKSRHPKFKLLLPPHFRNSPIPPRIKRYKFENEREEMKEGNKKNNKVNPKAITGFDLHTAKEDGAGSCEAEKNYALW